MEPRFGSATCTDPRGSGRHGRCAAEPREKKRRGRRRRPRFSPWRRSRLPRHSPAPRAMRHSEPNARLLALGSPRCDTARSSRDDPRARRRRAPTEHLTAGIRPQHAHVAVHRARRPRYAPQRDLYEGTPASTCSPCRKTSWRRACSAASTPPGTSRFEIPVASRGPFPTSSFPALSAASSHARSPPVPARISRANLNVQRTRPSSPRDRCSPRRARPSEDPAAVRPPRERHLGPRAPGVRQRTVRTLPPSSAASPSFGLQPHHRRRQEGCGEPAPSPPHQALEDFSHRRHPHRRLRHRHLRRRGLPHRRGAPKADSAGVARSPAAAPPAAPRGHSSAPGGSEGKLIGGFPSAAPQAVTTTTTPPVAVGTTNRAISTREPPRGPPGGIRSMACDGAQRR